MAISKKYHISYTGDGKTGVPPESLYYTSALIISTIGLGSFYGIILNSDVMATKPLVAIHSSHKNMT